MKNYKDPRPLVIIIIVLLISNIGLLAAWWYTSKQENHHNKRTTEMTAYLENEIGFSPAQLAALNTLREEKKAKDSAIFITMKQDKQAKYRELGNAAFSDSAVNNAVAYGAEKQKEFERSMIESLKNIRNICTPEQRAKFDTGFYKIFNNKKSGKH